MDPTVATLGRLGLTEYGARAYVALVGLGPASATAVAEASEIPRTKVYGVLDELVDAAWVEAGGGRPRTYRARPPRTCLDRERARFEEELDATLAVLEVQYEEEAVRFGGPMWVLGTTTSIAERLTSMARAARNDVFLSLPFPLPNDDALADLLAKAVERDVRVRLLVQPEGPRLDVPGAEVRIGALPIRVTLVDERQALVVFPVPRPGGGVDARGLWNASPELVGHMKGVAAHVWSTGEPLA